MGYEVSLLLFCSSSTLSQCLLQIIFKVFCVGIFWILSFISIFIKSYYIDITLWNLGLYYYLYIFPKVLPCISRIEACWTTFLKMKSLEYEVGCFRLTFRSYNFHTSLHISKSTRVVTLHVSWDTRPPADDMLTRMKEAMNENLMKVIQLSMNGPPCQSEAISAYVRMRTGM